MVRNAYTVGQVNSYIKHMFTQDYMLNRLYIKGEVSNCKYHTSGHIYFTLKDETGTIACVMFAGQRRGLAFRLADGQKVLVLGSVSVYERDGRYQVYAREIVLDGEGDLYQRFLKLKTELEEMGMFAPEYKKPVPRFANRVGIVTAKTGAAIQDICNISYRRNPYIQLILYPATVQGEGAKNTIVDGIRTLDAYGVDVIIVGRGGGSIEDLWAFNEEEVARAIFNCETPVISAVGHETDFTIADFVADLRAPTPSAAAELAVSEMDALEEQLAADAATLRRYMRQQIVCARERQKQMQLRMQICNPHHQLQQKQQYIVDMQEHLSEAMHRLIERRRHALQLAAGRLDGLSPLKKLSQGYAFATDAQAHVLNNIEQVRNGDAIHVHVRNGCIEAKVSGVSAIERGLADGSEEG